MLRPDEEEILKTYLDEALKRIRDLEEFIAREGLQSPQPTELLLRLIQTRAKAKAASL